MLYHIYSSCQSSLADKGIVVLFTGDMKGDYLSASSHVSRSPGVHWS